MIKSLNFLFVAYTNNKVLIVRNLEFETTQETFEAAFKDAKKCRLITDPDSGKCMG